MSSRGSSVPRPRPLQPFTLGSPSDQAFPSRSQSPSLHAQQPSPGLSPGNIDDHTSPPSRNRSILNLTSSALSGIYGMAGYATDKDGTTPWGTGAETPLGSPTPRNSQPDGQGLGLDAAIWRERSKRRRSSVLDTSATRTRQRQKSLSSKKRTVKSQWASLMGKNCALGVVGLCYGLLISQLHDRQHIVPIKVHGIPHHTWAYLGFWTIIAIVLGQSMPWIDRFWESSVQDDEVEDEQTATSTQAEKEGQGKSGKRGSWAPHWNDVVRSIGAFVGIAFAIRKLPWVSTLQLSLTLALSNPAIWYLLDRTPPGFVFSSTVALSGTALCLAINPNLIPAPASYARQSIASMAGNATAASSDELVAGLFSHESVGVATWIASVLFVSAVCFGNIGRRL